MRRRNQATAGASVLRLFPGDRIYQRLLALAALSFAMAGLLFSGTAWHQDPPTGGFGGSACVVVLGEMLLPPDGRPSPNLHARVEAAREFVVARTPTSSGVVVRHHVVLSGGDAAGLDRTEASVMAELWANGVVGSDGGGRPAGGTHPAAAATLHLEGASLSTCQNAYFSVPILRRIGPESSW